MSRNKEQNKKKIVKIFKENPITSSVCKKAGVSRSTFYRWLEEDSQFKKDADTALEIGRNRMIDVAESKLLSKVNEGDQRAVEFYLKNNSRRYVTPTVRFVVNQHNMEIKDLEEQFRQARAAQEGIFNMLSTEELKRLAGLEGSDDINTQDS